MWSVGCLFVELLTLEPLFIDCLSEMDLVLSIFEITGTPSIEMIVELYGK